MSVTITEHLWSAQTQRSHLNFPIGVETDFTWHPTRI
jgi:hypothetical protein